MTIDKMLNRQLYFVAVILKVFLVNPLAVLNFANKKR